MASKRAPALRGGVSAAAAHAVSVALVEIGARQHPIAADASDGYVSAEEANALLEDAARVLGDDAVALRIANVLEPGRLGLIDYAVLLNPTWGAGLRMLARYFPLTSTGATLEVHDTDDQAWVSLWRVSRRLSYHWVELFFGVLVDRGRVALGPEWQLSALELAHAAPRTGGDHAAWFRAPVTFGARVDRMVFERRWLDAPMQTGVGALADMLEQRLAALIPPQHDPLVVRTRQAVISALDAGEAPSISTVARKLAMSTRTLQRNLGERNRSFHAIVDGVRHAFVLELLRDNELTLTEIAERVGFADQTGLIRAFRRWSGTTPRVPSSP